jgi:DNA primase
MASQEKPDLLRVLSAAGVDVSNDRGKQSFQTWCPFHGDSPRSHDGKPGRPNLHVRLDRQTFKCYRCGVHGDVYDFIGMKIYGDGWDPKNKEQFKQAIRELENLLNVSLSRPYPAIRSSVKKEDLPPPPIRIADREKTELQTLTFAASVYYATLFMPQRKPALKYLEGRGIRRETIDAFRIGWATGNSLSLSLLLYPKAMKENAEKASLFNDTGREYFFRRIIIPDRGRDGLIYYMTGRSLEKEPKIRYLGLRGGKTIWGIHRIRKDERVFLVESPMDALSLWQCGFQAIAVQGTDFDTQWDSQLMEIPALVILPQNDQPAEDTLTGPRSWTARLPHAIVRRIPKTYKDINDILMAGGTEGLKAVIDQITQ